MGSPGSLRVCRALKTVPSLFAVSVGGRSCRTVQLDMRTFGQRAYCRQRAERGGLPVCPCKLPRLGEDAVAESLKDGAVIFTRRSRVYPSTLPPLTVVRNVPPALWLVRGRPVVVLPHGCQGGASAPSSVDSAAQNTHWVGQNTTVRRRGGCVLHSCQAIPADGPIGGSLDSRGRPHLGLGIIHQCKNRLGSLSSRAHASIC